VLIVISHFFRAVIINNIIVVSRLAKMRASVIGANINVDQMVIIERISNVLIKSGSNIALIIGVTIAKIILIILSEIVSKLDSTNKKIVYFESVIPLKTTRCSLQRATHYLLQTLFKTLLNQELIISFLLRILGLQRATR
jgi:hypothetical protein